jgi:hypothetical protein
MQQKHSQADIVDINIKMGRGRGVTRIAGATA